MSDVDSVALDRRHSDAASPDRCVTCHGKKVFRWYAYDDGRRTPEVVEYDCNCIDQWILYRFLLNCGIGKNYQRYDWDDLVITPPTQMVRWLDNAEACINAGLGFVLTGDRGNGKSLLTTLGLKSLIAQGHDCYFTTFAEMIDYVTAAWRGKQERNWFINRIRNAGVLAIDDVGRESGAVQKGRVRTRAEVAAGVSSTEIREAVPFMSAALEEMVRYRVAQAKPTIITTNLPFEEIAETYSDNLFSLLHERSTVIHFGTEDYRPTANRIFDDEVFSGLSRPLVLA